jgi:hypothetical protein
MSGDVARIIGFGLACICSAGCGHNLYAPELATRPYPDKLHTAAPVDMQVFRRGTDIEIVNSTARSYADLDLWINQRYVRHLASLPAGKTIRLGLWDFRDEHGDAFYAGGFFRAYPATPVRLVEIQAAEDQPMIGLIAIRSEEVSVKPEPGR